MSNVPIFSAIARAGRGFRRIGKDRRGNVMMIFAFAMIPMIFMAGFAIDYSRAMKLRTRMNAAADAAALAAVNVKMMQESDTAARAAARSMFISQVTGLEGLVYDVSNSANPTITIQSNGGVNTRRTVTVSYRAASTNIFSGILGAPTLPVVGEVTADATRAPHVNFFLLMDTSPSMLLPASSTGLKSIRDVTGCAFACHNQNPHEEGQYIRDPRAKDTWIDLASKATCTVNRTTDSRVYCTNGKNYKKSDGQYTNNDIWLDNSGSACTSAYEDNTYLYCINKTKFRKSAGQYADSYWLTRNYAALYGGENITLRIDEEQKAAQNLIPFAINTAANNYVTYKLQLFTFDWTHPSTSHPVDTITSSMTDVNNLSGYTVPNFYDLQDNWYRNNCPTSSFCNSDRGSEVSNALARMNTIMPNPGDGSSTANPQEVLFIITDGVADELYGGNRWNREWNSDNLAKCTAIKNRGIRIAILYTEYLPESLTGDSWSMTNVAPYLPRVEDALKSCASSRPDGSPLYYKVTTDDSISKALNALFALTVQTAILTK
jgi:Flp pilus assembly protein TadG